MYKIRFANENDAIGVLEIYAPYIVSTPVTFETEVPEPFEMRRRIHSICEKFPYLVCEIDGVIAGYAYASSLFSRAAYMWDAELSVYIREDYQRCNIASALYYAVIEFLKLTGYMNVVARITVPNVKSENFHLAFGFSKVGVLTRSGFKLGAWHDVAIYEKHLFDDFSEPKPIIPIAELDEEKTKKVIASAEKIIKIKK